MRNLKLVPQQNLSEKERADYVSEQLRLKSQDQSGTDGELTEKQKSDYVAEKLGLPTHKNVKLEGKSYTKFLEETVSKINENETLEANLRGIPELNDEEVDYLLDKKSSGELEGPLFDEALKVMAGKHERQKKMVTKSELGHDIIVDVPDPSKETNPIKRKMAADAASIMGNKGNYYMKDYGNGIKVPVPLMFNERPEAGYVAETESIWGTQKEAKDDFWLTDIAKRAANLVPTMVQGFISIPEVAVGLSGGDVTPFQAAKGQIEKTKFKTSEDYRKTVVDVSKIESYKDLFSSEIYDFSPAKIVNTAVAVAESFAQIALTRGAMGAGKAATFGATYISGLTEAIDSAERAGVEGQSKYAVAASVAGIQAGIESKFGIEGKILNGASSAARKQMINQIIKDNVKIVDGKLTRESVEKLFTEITEKETNFFAKLGKNSLSEATTEVAQSITLKAAENLHDKLLQDDPDATKYGTVWYSPQAIGDYISSAATGFAGGALGSPFVREKQSRAAYDAVSNGKESELKSELAGALTRKKITKEDYDRGIFKINSYKSYYDATKDRNVTDEEKRKIFDLTYEKENTKSGIERLKQNNPGGINDELIATKEQQINDYSQQIKDIWAASEARTSEAPVEEAKVEVPQWRTAMDDFSKEVGNDDKRQSINNSTRDQIQTVVGASPELNKLAEPFSVDFTSPHLPEQSTIQIRNGILYEPYLVKQEGEEDVIETRQLPVYAMEDKDGGAWLFAIGEKTDTDAQDVTYLIKLDNDEKYEGHVEFKYRTAKKNELTFDDIVPTFNKLGIKAASLTDEIKGIENIPQAEFEEIEDIEMEAEDVAPIESEQFKNVYEKVKAGVGKAKLKLLPNNAVGVTIDGEDVPFASQRYLNKEDLPSGDVEVNVRTVENVEGKYGRGVLVEAEDGTPLGYIRRAGKVETGRVAAEKISPTEDVDIDVPVELSDAAKEKIQQIEKDQENYELVEDELSRRYVNKKTGESYTSVSTFVSGKSGGDFEGKKQLKETAFKVGNIINGIVKDFFNGTIKAYSNYAENISRDDYDDIVRQLQDVNEYAKDKGYSIVTKPLIIADDVNKIAGQPNLLMVDENGKFYVYDVATLKNTYGLETKELLNKRYKDRPTNAERISAQVNILADILNNKYGLEVGRVGVIPFNVDYNVLSKDKPVKITHAVRTKRVDFKRKQILKPTGKTSATEVKEKVEEIKPKEYEQEGVKEEGIREPSEEVQRGDVKEIKVRRRKIGVPKAKRKIRNKRILEIINKVPNNPFEAVLIEFIKGTKLNTSAFQELFGNKLDILEGKKISKSAMAEAKIRVAFWNNKIGLGIKQLAHKLWEKGDTEFYKDTDYREAIEQIIIEYPTLSSMIEYFNTLDQIDKDAAEFAEMNAFLAGVAKEGIYPEELEDYWNSLTPEQQEAIANDNIIPDDFNDYIEDELTSEETKKDIESEEEGKDIVRGEGEDYPFQKAKSVKSIFDESVKLFYKIRGTEGAAKKRNLTQERKELLKENPSVRFIDNNISSIFEQLEKKGIIKRKGNCP